MSGSNEFFYVTDGKKQDAELHEEWLDNPAAERVALGLTRASLKIAGTDPAVIERLYPIPDKRSIAEPTMGQTGREQ